MVAERVDTVFRRGDSGWSIEHGGRVVRVANSPGMRVLAHLIANPKKLLKGSVLLPLLQESGEAFAMRLNGQTPARGDYRRRLNLIRSDLRRARERNDSAAVRKLESELQMLTRELARAIGLAEDNPNSAADRIVADAIDRGIAAIAKCDRALAQHLRRAVTIGRTFSYHPDHR